MLSPNASCVESHIYAQVGCVSVAPTDDFIVRIINLKSSSCADMSFREGHVLVGFINPSRFVPNAEISHRAYTFYAGIGALYGQGCRRRGYSTAVPEGIVRCVVDRTACTISFTANGVDLGTAYTCVPAEPLHAYCQFVYGNVALESLCCPL